MDISITSFYKPLIVFIGLFILIRITGKKQLSEITYYDYISGVTIGAIAGAASVNEKVSIYKIDNNMSNEKINNIWTIVLTNT